MNVVKISKEEIKAVKHLYNATSRDESRPSLMAIQVNEDICNAASGFITATINTPECLKEYAGQLVSFNKRPVTGLNEITIEEGNYPDLSEVTKDLDHTVKFSVNATILVNLLKDLPKNTQVSFESVDLVTPIKVNTANYADIKSNMLIVPMRSDNVSFGELS